MKEQENDKPSGLSGQGNESGDGPSQPWTVPLLKQPALLLTFPFQPIPEMVTVLWSPRLSPLLTEGTSQGN